MKTHCATLAFLALTAGCSDLSGLGGTSQFACKAPVGVHCESLSATYYNSVANNLPAQRRTPASSGKINNATRDPQPATNQAADGPAPGFAPVALRSPSREMRIWIKAWQDEDKDLTDQSYVYLVVNEGQWRVAHVQQQERDAFARLTPPLSVAKAEGAALAQPVAPTPMAPAPATLVGDATEPSGR
jgi:conjugal transfer pilus assembly protein TraV